MSTSCCFIILNTDSEYKEIYLQERKSNELKNFMRNRIRLHTAKWKSEFGLYTHSSLRCQCSGHVKFTRYLLAYVLQSDFSLFFEIFENQIPQHKSCNIRSSRQALSIQLTHGMFPLLQYFDVTGDRCHSLKYVLVILEWLHCY